MIPYYQDKLCRIYHADPEGIAPRLGEVDFVFGDPLVTKGAKGADKIAEFDRVNNLAQWLFDYAGQKLRHRGICACICGPRDTSENRLALWSAWLAEHLYLKTTLTWAVVGEPTLCLLGQKGLGKKRWPYRDAPQDLPAIKPIAKTNPLPTGAVLQGHLIARHTEPGEIVVDPFLGDGWTLVAAKLMGRRAVGISTSLNECRAAAKRLKAIVTPHSALRTPHSP